MRKTATAATTTTSAAPREGGAAPDLWERLAAPFAAEEVRSRRGPRGDLRYITARTARRRLERRPRTGQLVLPGRARRPLGALLAHDHLA